MKFKLSLSLLFILITSINVISQNRKPSDQRVALSDGLVAYYPFEENSKDYTGNENTGIDKENVYYNTGFLGNSADFTANLENNRIEILASNSLKFTNEFTFSGWYNFTDFVGNNGYVSLFAKSGDAPGLSALYNFEKSTISLSNSISKNQSVSAVIEPFEKNKWYHLAFVIKNDILKIYVNGKNVVNQSVGEKFDFSDANEQMLSLGGFGGSNCCWYSFDGFIDEVKIYNKALDIIQVNDIYNTTLCQIAKPEISDVYNCVGESSSIQFQEKENPNYKITWYYLEGENIANINKPLLFNSTAGETSYYVKNDSSTCNSEFLLVKNIVNDIPEISPLSATVNTNQDVFSAFGIQDSQEYTWNPSKPTSLTVGKFNGTYIKTTNKCSSKSETWDLEVTEPIDFCQGLLPNIYFNFYSKLYLGDTVEFNVSAGYSDEMCSFDGTTSISISDPSIAQIYNDNKLILLKSGEFSITVNVVDTVFNKPNQETFNYKVLLPYKNVETIKTLGYNVDVVADLENSVSTTTDGAVDQINYCFECEALIGTARKSNNLSNAKIASFGNSFYSKTDLAQGGLPLNGEIKSQSNKGLFYQLQPYSQPNSLQLVANYEDTLNLETPKAYEKLFILATCGNGNSNVQVKILFEDNTFHQQNIEIKDWYYNDEYAIKSIGRVSRSTSSVEFDFSNPRIYDNVIEIPASFSTKNVKQILFLFTDVQSSAVPNIMAVSGQFIPPLVNSTALHFDGIDDYVSVDSNITLSKGDKAYTLQAKIKPLKNGDFGIIGYGNYQENNKVNALRLASDGGLINYWWANDLVVTSDSLSKKGINLTDGNWHDVTATYDGVKRKMYVDGILFNEDAPTDTLSVVNTKNLTIGVTNSKEFFNGGIDEVRVWNRALCKAEIVNNLNCETPSNQSGLLLNYHFNQGYDNQNNDTITSVFDSSINGFKGKLNNFDLKADTISNWFAPLNVAVVVGSTCNGFNIATAPIAPPAIEACKNSGNVDLFSVGEGLTWYNSKKEVKGTNITPTISTTQVDTLFKYITRFFGSCETNRTKVEIRINPLPNVIATATDTSICIGDTVTLKGTGALIYQWFGVSDNIPFVPTETKYYKVRGKFTSTGCVGEDSIKVKVNQLPTVVSNISKNEICKGDSVKLYGTGAKSYTWNNGVIDDKFFVINSSDIFNVIGVDSNGCKSSSSIEVDVKSLPFVVANVSKSVICKGDSISVSAEGADSYVWSSGIKNNEMFKVESDTSLIVTGTDWNNCKSNDTLNLVVNTLPTIIFNPEKPQVCIGDSIILNASGSGLSYTWEKLFSSDIKVAPIKDSIFNVETSDKNGCKNVASINVEVHQLPNVSVQGAGSICLGGNGLQLTATGGKFYSWSPKTGLSNPMNSNPIASPLVTTKYTVTATDSNGCVGSSTAEIVVDNKSTSPTLTITASDTAICEGGNVKLTASGTADKYIWTNSVINDSIFVPSKTLSYVVTATNLSTNCSISDSIKVVVNQLPNVSIKATKTEICFGDSLKLTATGDADTYLWNNLVKNDTIFSPSSTQTYKVTATIESSKCSVSDSINIVVNKMPQLNLSASKTEICFGDSLKLTASGIADTFIWNNGVKNDTLFAPSNTQTYKVTASNIQSNCSVSDSIKVVVNQLPNVSIKATKTEICFGDSLKLTATGDADTYLWNNLVKNDTIFSPSSTQTYKVTATIESSKCSVSDSINIVVNKMPQLNLSASKTEICFGDSLKLTASGIADTFIWNNGVKNDTLFAPSNTQTYKVTASNIQSNCSVSDSIKVVVNQLPNVIANVSKTTICLGDSIELKANGTALNYTWNNTIANNTKVAPPINNSKYLVKGVDEKGCSDTTSVNITVLALPLKPTVTNNDYCVNETADTLKAIATAGNMLQWFADDSITIINNLKPNTLTPGLQSFFVNQKNVAGCESEKAKLTVTVFAKPTIPTFAQNNDTITIDTLSSKIQLNSISNLKKINWIIEPTIAGTTNDTLILSTFNWTNKYSGVVNIKAQAIDVNSCKSDTSANFLLTRIGKANLIKKDTVINQLDSIIVTINVNASLPVEITYTYVDSLNQTSERVLKNINVNTTYIKIGANDKVQNIRIKDNNNVVVFVDSIQVIKNAGNVLVDLPNLYPGKVYFNDTIKLDLNGTGGPYVVTYKYNNVIYAKTVNADKFEIQLISIINDSIGSFELLSVKNLIGDTLAISGNKKADFVFDVLNDISVTLTDKSIPFCNEGTGLVNLDLNGGKQPYKAILKDKSTALIDTLEVNVESSGGYSIRQKSGSYSLQIIDAAGYVNKSLATQNITIAQSLSTVIENTKPVLAINTGLNPLNLLNGKDTSITITANANTGNPDTKLSWTYPSTSIFPSEVGTFAINGNVANLNWATQYSGILKVLIQGELFGCKTKYSDTLQLVYKPNVKYKIVNENVVLKYDSIAIDLQTFGKAPFRLKYSIKNGDMLTTVYDTIFDKKRIYFNYAESISFITITDANGIETSILLTEKNSLYNENLGFYEAFSPNNDGHNDYFIIGNYMDQKNTKFLNKPGALYVYDRSGFEVYRDLEYKNNWSGDGLNDGIYYYVFIRSESDKFGSFVEIRR
ncbi:MAG: hypothetical protein RLZZ175_1889 [Bacteroidota bacterium]|jgi:hypothetical protein